LSEVYENVSCDFLGSQIILFGIRKLVELFFGRYGVIHYCIRQNIPSFPNRTHGARIITLLYYHNRIVKSTLF
jgi:hypothetical protein